MSGIGLIFIGLFKKLCLADRLTPFVYPGFLNPAASDGYALLVGLLGMPAALYLDFSAYTDIARGSGRMLGVEIIRNFDFPFTSQSPGELWQRWHISLTSWMRDYVFLALPGQAVLSLLVPAALLGLWHGAHWKFVLWGVGNGLALGLYALWRIHGPSASARRRQRPLAMLGTLVSGATRCSSCRSSFVPTCPRGRLLAGPLHAALGRPGGSQPHRARCLSRPLHRGAVGGSLCRLARGLGRVPGLGAGGSPSRSLVYVVLFGAGPGRACGSYYQQL
jgi:hypothetical protein